jgi:hypothetical protein
VLPGIVGVPVSVRLEDNLRVQQVRVGVDYRFFTGGEAVGYSPEEAVGKAINILIPEEIPD